MEEIPDSAPEKAILAVKYAAHPMGKLGLPELMDTATVLLVKIFVITGWEIPAGKIKDILVDQLTKHLRESYMTVNMYEVEYAFRQYGTSIKDWGKTMNLGLFDQVMSQYMEARRIASDEEQRRPLPALALPATKLTSEEIIIFSRDLWNKMQNIDLIYPDAFQALVDAGKITYPLSKEDNKIYLQLADKRMQQHMMKDKHFFDDKDYKVWRRIYARKLVVADYFSSEEISDQ